MSSAEIHKILGRSAAEELVVARGDDDGAVRSRDIARDYLHVRVVLLGLSHRVGDVLAVTVGGIDDQKIIVDGIGEVRDVGIVKHQHQRIQRIILRQDRVFD